MTGGCLCRGIRFELDPPLRDVVVCHCSLCRRSGTLAGAYTAVPRDALRLTADGTLRWYVDVNERQRGFCGTCGSPLTYENVKLPDEVHVLAGALSDPSAVRPSAHIVVKEQLPWFEAADELPRYTRWRSDGPPVRYGPRP